MPTPYFDWRYNGRWDHRFNDKNSAFFSYTNQHNNGLNDQSSNNNDLTAGNFTTNQLILASVNFNSVITPKIVNSATVGYQYWNNLIDSTSKFPTVSFASGEYFGTNGNVPQQSFQKKWQFKDDISINRGRHNFKTGFDWVHEPALGGFFEFTPTPAVTFIDDPSTILGNKTLYPQGFATAGRDQQHLRDVRQPVLLPEDEHVRRVLPGRLEGEPAPDAEPGRAVGPRLQPRGRPDRNCARAPTRN